MPLPITDQGRGMAIGREHRLWTSALAAALALNGAPLLAQAAPAPATNTRTTAPTPIPAPTSNDVVGPEQLRDFNLNGTVTQRPDPAPVTTQPTPTESPTTSGPAATAPDRPAAASTGRSAPPVRQLPSVTDSIAAPAPLAETPVDDIAPGFGADAPVIAPVAPPVVEPDADSGPPWPWILAALAAVLGAGLLFWRRRHGSEHRDEGCAIAGAGAAPTPQPRALQPTAPQPRAPAPPTPRPAPAAAPRPVPTATSRPAPNTQPTPTPAPAPVAGGIVASRLKPSIAFELRPIRAESGCRARRRFVVRRSRDQQWQRARARRAGRSPVDQCRSAAG